MNGQSQEVATNCLQQDCQYHTLPTISSDFMNNMLNAGNMNNIPIYQSYDLLLTLQEAPYTVNVTFISPLMEVPSFFKLLHNPVKPYLQDL